MDGTPFGRYRLIELLGRGGMGEVWRAHDTVIDRTVAIKTLLPHFAQDKTFEQRFRREARAAARLDDPHIVPIYDVGEIDGRLYVAMRLINGQDLQTLLDQGPLKLDRAVNITEQIASALHAAHKVGLVHRDIKPSNILVADDDFAYLIDFGIARATGETGITSTGATIGTWSYMAPERFSSGEIEPSADVYALACVLYQSLTGELPFPGTTLEQVAMAHMTAPPPKPSAQRHGIPTAMDDVIATGLAKSPGQRYRTAKDLARAARTAIPTREQAQAETVIADTQEAPARPAPDRSAAPEVDDRPPFQRPTQPAPPRWWRRKTKRRTAIAVLAAAGAVLATAVVFAGAALRLYLADSTAAHAKSEIIQTATEAMTTLWSYTPNDIEQLRDRSGKYLGGDIQDRYRKFIDEIAVPDKQAQVTNETQVMGAGVETLNGSDATVLIYVNTTSTTPQTRDKPSLKYLSYRLIMHKSDSRWVITKMTTVTSLDLQPKLPGTG